MEKRMFEYLEKNTIGQSTSLKMEWGLGELAFNLNHDMGHISTEDLEKLWNGQIAFEKEDENFFVKVSRIEGK